MSERGASERANKHKKSSSFERATTNQKVHCRGKKLKKNSTTTKKLSHREKLGIARSHLALADDAQGNYRSAPAYIGVLFVSFWILLSYMVRTDFCFCFFEFFSGFFFPVFFSSSLSSSSSSSLSL